MNDIDFKHNIVSSQSIYTVKESFDGHNCNWFLIVATLYQKSKCLFLRLKLFFKTICTNIFFHLTNPCEYFLKPTITLQILTLVQAGRSRYFLSKHKMFLKYAYNHFQCKYIYRCITLGKSWYHIILLKCCKWIGINDYLFQFRNAFSIVCDSRRAAGFSCASDWDFYSTLKFYSSTFIWSANSYNKNNMG